MPRRYQSSVKDSNLSLKNLFLALRVCFKRGYSLSDYRADAVAGIVVGIVALPLSMALAIASGVPPQHGLYTAIVAGAIIALAGGSRHNVSGPTAAFVVILAPISAKFGLAGLLVATVMAGLILFAMGVAKLGRLIQFIPHPVTTGFTSGIAVVIATLQIKDFFGLDVAYPSEHYLARVVAIVKALPTFHVADLAIAVATLAVLIVLPKLTRKVPAPLVAVVGASFLGLLIAKVFPEALFSTIGGRFSYASGGQVLPGIPQLPPIPVLPWTLPGPDGTPFALSFDVMRTLAGPAFAIAMLGAIESLLCAVVSDGMAGSRHDPDVELMAQGLGNVVAPFFGGIPATAAIARTATSIRAGGKTPLAAFFHALFVLAAVLAIAPLLAFVPMAALAALLLVVAWNMAEIDHFSHIVRVAPVSDVTVLLACFFCTVVFDMVVAVAIGVVLAAFLFMRRMAEISGAKLYSDGASHPDVKLPRGVLLYEINGPLFFGAAEKAVAALETVTEHAKHVLLDVSAVPAIDVTGLVALESAVDKLKRDRVCVVMVGTNPQPFQVLSKAGFKEEPGHFTFKPTLEDALRFIEKESGGKDAS
jgi:SulP family sulfate permease